jgi:DNA ligase-associated metallophosphoesterase
MKITEQAIIFSGEDLILTNQRAAFWEGKKALILSDLHLGKAAHFRKNGIPLPTQITLQDLNRLEGLIRHFNAEQVIVVGDLIHSGENKEVDLFAGLTQKFASTSFVLIKGNHDRFSESRLAAMGIQSVHHSLYSDPILFVHHYPEEEKESRDKKKNPAGLKKTLQMETAEAFICGHLHPGIRLPLPSKRHMRFPCYVVTGRRLILPAFSRFTGLDTSCIPEKAVCYALYEEDIFKIEP